MKTAREWFKLLPPDVEKMAVENAEAYCDGDYIDLRYPSLGIAISATFSWIKSKQGIRFWVEIFQAAQRGEYERPGDA